jgi:geranylgeranyl diphosphate synthase type II
MKNKSMNKPIDVRAYLTEKKEVIDDALDRFLPLAEVYPSSIHQAMRYSVLGDGKRFRPILAVTIFDMLGGKETTILQAACALELIHTYSLIHDDLPCMDDDDWRRGKPTLHKAFDEAVAVLAGDALSALAFELLAATGRSDIIKEVASAIGTHGMVGGQVVDIQTEGKVFVSQELEYIHSHKTGALITISARVGALLAEVKETELVAITRFGDKMGLAFQIVDDILNLEGEQEHIGKNTGTDQAKKKATYPALFGLEQSKHEARRLIVGSKKELDMFGSSAYILKALADFVIERTR